MGTGFYKLGDDAAGILEKFETKPDGVVWIVGRVVAKADPIPAEIHLQGVSLNEQMAVNMCIDETYFVGPIPLNILLAEKPIPWAGLYFPLKQ